MPVSDIHHISENALYGIWKIEENAELLRKKVKLSTYEMEEYRNFDNVKRKKEWLAVRNMLQSLCRQQKIPYKGIVKDEHNKPHLIGSPWHISISHSFPYAVALLNRSDACGIDIEKVRPAVFQVSKRYLKEQELEEIPRDPAYLCAAWAAKEVLYKVYGRKGLSFKENISLSPFLLAAEGQIEARIQLDMGTGNYVLKYVKVDDFILCYST